ncbi:class I adenylate-forming enzyme family protein [Humibacter ginsenosidimutans]|uniref:AMP-binding protein n=1 Tax=Humibacter ginsenosidimutans TaxID=2599293 RepID=A0A5B8M413_9MICO|nr:AMP-binding protein [Humibacter ginsenosidimutans]QDZ14699.1 AMP-binding protein [Humibacter ginsenosidimutans]
MNTISSSDIDRRRDALERTLGSWVPRSLAAAFDVAVARHPDRPYVVTDAGTLTYAQVAERSRRLATGLIELGVRKGDRVAMLMDNRLDYPIVKFAIARVGAVAVALNYLYRGDEIVTRLQQSGARVLISIDSSAATDFLAVFDERFGRWESGVNSDDVPTLRQIVLAESGWRSGALTVPGLSRELDDQLVDEATQAVLADDVADIVFTSGTTGHALGAELTHDMLLRSAYGSAYHRAFDDGWRIGFALPLYHVFGYVEGMLAAVFAGGAIVPQRVFNPRTTLELIQQHGINEVLFVPTMTVAVVDQAVKDDYDLSSLQSVFSAAAPAPVWLWNRVMTDLNPQMIFTGYGQTEVSAATALTLPGDSIELVSSVVGTPKLGGLAAVGTGIPNGRLAEYRTIDPFDGHVLPQGESGELVVRGPQVTREYIGESAQAAAAIDEDGWLRTGDLGWVDDDGYLHLSGRSKELFKVGGELVAPLEVEQVLTAYDGVNQAYVAGIPDERYGEIGWAWVVAAEDAVLDERALLAHARTHLAPFKVPRGMTVVMVEELPMTTTGKVQKYQLVQWIVEGRPA